MATVRVSGMNWRRPSPGPLPQGHHPRPPDAPAGFEERLRGREDLGEGGVAGDGHRVVEAQLTPPRPPARNTPHVSNSRSARLTRASFPKPNYEIKCLVLLCDVGAQ